MQRGASLVEAALSLFLVLNVIFWTIELCLLLYTHTVLADAVNEGVRYAIVHSSDTGDGAAKTVAKNYASYSLRSFSESDISVTHPDGDQSPPHRVKMEITYTYAQFVRPFGFTPPTLHVYAEGRYVY